MIRAIITDIDGVILGNKTGFNFPELSIKTQDAIKQLQKKSISISLCTAKAYFAIKQRIISPNNLNGIHISDAGALITTAATGEIIVNAINNRIAEELSSIINNENIYIELYTPNNYYIFDNTNRNRAIYEGRVNNLGKQPVTIKSVKEISEPIIKLYTLPETYFKRDLLNELAAKYQESVVLRWGKNPSLFPEMAGFYTSLQATKAHSVMQLAKIQPIPLSETLAIGDSTNDWSFMQLCGYAATLANGTPELQQSVSRLGEYGYVSSRSVNEDGFSDIIEHFFNTASN